jgi:hypothetical protein
VQLVARLQRTSMVTAVATDAVHRVAQSRDRAEVEARVRRLLGPSAEIVWTTGHGRVTVDLVVDSPLVPGLSADIHRGATARVEAVG